MYFEFSTAARVIFGAGSIREVRGAAKGMGSRALVVTGSTPERASCLNLSNQVVFPIRGEPRIERIREGVRLAHEEQCDFVIGLGGGSAMDAGKAIAILMTNSGEPLDYLEGVGAGKAIAYASAPFVAIPTTAGTGSEATRNAVLTCSQRGVKASLRHPSMLPRLAVVDPELTFPLPAEITASTGLDALTQLIEAFTSIRANPVTDALCVDGIRRVEDALPQAWRDGQNAQARTDMALASLYGGMALANAGLGAVHGFAAPIGGMFAAPHGAVCAALLPYVTEMNIHALKARAGESEVVGRYAAIGGILSGTDDPVTWLRVVCRDMGIPPLRAYGVEQRHVSEIVEKATRASSMKSNPIVLTREELTDVLESAI
ncbi:MAG TPA: iron-containing alcohol dehydrogenase [Bryobacteraceae bacterium]|nr:iron-containing alcohol dehydrogenase [Bryobacteraceae bacterium]